MTKATKDNMQRIAGHLLYAAQMHAAQASHWLLAYVGEQNKLGSRATAYLSMSQESNSAAQEATRLADSVKRGMTL